MIIRNNKNESTIYEVIVWYNVRKVLLWNKRNR